MKNKSDFFMTLAVFLCAAALLGGLVFAIVGNPLQKSHLTFTVDFEDISGIRVNSNVVFAGDRVGKVEKIEHLAPGDRLTPEAAVRLTLAIEKEVPIPKEIEVSLAAESMLSEKQVSLQRISTESDLPLMVSGDQIVAGSPQSLLDSFLPGASDIVAKLGEIAEDIESLTGRFNEGEDGKNLSGALADIRKMTSSLNTSVSGDEEDPGLAERLNRVSANLDELSAELNVLVKGEGDSPGLTARIDSITGKLESFAGEADALMAGSEGDPGLHDKIDSIADEIEIMLAGNEQQPGLRNRIDTLGAEVQELLAGTEGDPGLKQRLNGTLERVDLLLLEMKTLVVWGEYFTGSVASRPNRLLFGREKDIPTKEEILEYLRKGEPYPVDFNRTGSSASEEKSRPRRAPNPILRKH